MTTKTATFVCECGAKCVKKEYEEGVKYRYDGFNEWVCPVDGKRFGRWCEKEITEDVMFEPAFCQGNGHPRQWTL